MSFNMGFLFLGVVFVGFWSLVCKCDVLVNFRIWEFVVVIFVIFGLLVLVIDGDVILILGFVSIVNVINLEFLWEWCMGFVL